jgi:MoxR-like ATPase
MQTTLDRKKEKITKDVVQGSLNIKLPIVGMIKKATKKHLPEFIPELKEDFQKQIREAAKVLQPYIVVLPNKKEVNLTGRQHRDFDKALTLLSIHKQLMLSGPTGSGKTYLSEQLSKALDLSFSHISCTAGMSESHLTGRMVADGTYIPTSFVDLYENGGVFLLDEIDAADSNVLLVINSAIANGKMSIPNRKENPVAKRHENFHLVVASNTWGHGSFEYSGREILDKAFLDRFALSKTFIDYDENLELEITDSISLTSKLQYIRKNCKVERSISTRTILSAYKMSGSFNEKEIFDILTLDWTDEEKLKFKECLNDFEEAA